MTETPDNEEQPPGSPGAEPANGGRDAPPAEESTPSVRGSTMARLGSVRARLERERPHNRFVETGFRVVRRDKQIAGGVLGGGLAYRLFFLALSYSVLFFGALGLAGEDGAVEAGEEVGLGEALARTVGDAAFEAQSRRWWLLLTGVVLVLWFSFSLLRALRLVQAAAWRETVPPLRRAPRAVLNVLLCVVSIVAFTVALSWLREHGDLLGGLVAWLGGIAFFGALWMLVSERLPSGDVPLSAHLPGAALFGLGLWALQVFASFFLAEKLASSSELYGVLGVAATALFFLYLVGRGIVWAAVLNAATWEVRSGRSGHEGNASSLMASGSASDQPPP